MARKDENTRGRGQFIAWQCGRTGCRYHRGYQGQALRAHLFAKGFDRIMGSMPPEDCVTLWTLHDELGAV